MNKSVLLTVMAIFGANAAHATVPMTPGHWNNANDPKWFNNSSFNSLNINYDFDFLYNQHKEARMKDHIAWTDSYWPTNTGGIAFRWNSPEAAKYTDTRLNDASSVELRKSLGFTYRLYSLKDLQQMDEDTRYATLRTLSPAEKYDIFMGRFDYPTVKHERNKTNVNASYWFGICDGWTPAALNHAEPDVINEKDKNGVIKDPVYSKNNLLIPFGSADVKAMMNHYYNRSHEKSPEAWFARKQYHIANASMIGIECHQDITQVSDPRKLAECADANAGSFYVAMVNQLGVDGRGFGIDVDSGGEIWNQPVFAYKTEAIGEQGPSPGAAFGTAREVIMTTDLYYADDTFKGKAYYQPLVGTEDFLYDVVKYKYRLEIDSAGRVIGGEWLKRDLTAENGWLDKVDRTSAKFLAMNDYEKPQDRTSLEIRHNRPDQLWIQREANFNEGFGGYYGGIYKIYRAAKPGKVDFLDVKPGYETAKEDYDDYMSTP